MERVTPPGGAPIVLVEDNRQDASFVRRALESAGISNPLLVFATAHEARDHFDEGRQVELPALFVIDIVLVGGETGIEFLRWVRQQRAPLGTTPAMMLTGSTRPEHQDDAALLGSVYFLIKPVTAATLVAAVQSLGLVVSALSHGPRTIGPPR
jgi:CheY-like chemotaxis protein